VEVLRSCWRRRHGLALRLAGTDEIVFGDEEGRHRHPDRFSRPWNQAVARDRLTPVMLMTAG
jgi:hypothetical protein